MVAVIRNDLVIYLEVITITDLKAKQSFFGVPWKLTTKETNKTNQNSSIL